MNEIDYVERYVYYSRTLWKQSFVFESRGKYSRKQFPGVKETCVLEQNANNSSENEKYNEVEVGRSSLSRVSAFREVKVK